MLTSVRHAHSNDIAPGRYWQVAVILLQQTILYRIKRAKLLDSAQLPELARCSYLPVLVPVTGVAGTLVGT